MSDSDTNLPAVTPDVPPEGGNSGGKQGMFRNPAAWIIAIYVVTLAIISLAFGDWKIFVIGLSFALGLGLALVAFAYLSIFMKESLKFNPDQPGTLKLFLEVEEKHAVMIDRSGTPISIIRGGDKPSTVHKGEGEIASWQVVKATFEKDKPLGREKGEGLSIDQAQERLIKLSWLYPLFKWYQSYVWNNTGLYVYVPYFTKPKVIPLPRYRAKARDGVNIYTPVEEGQPGYYTDHVRIAPTTWYFRYKSVDIEGIPFNITGSILYRIGDDNEKIYSALYKTDAWNVLLDATTNSVIRAFVRKRTTIDKVLGRVRNFIFEEEESGKAPSDDEVREELYSELSRGLLEALRGNVIGEKIGGDVHEGVTGFETLEEYGIEIFQVFITDFEPDITNEELLKLRAPALGRQTARARVLAGKADATAQAELLKVHENGGEASDRIIGADALVRATQNGGGLLEALAAVLTQNAQGKK